jgi:hypothetical protein
MSEVCARLAIMAKRKDKDIGKDAKTGRFVLGSDRFAKISEVEGIRLTAGMKKRASEAKSKGLTAEEYRQTIIRSHQKR